MNKNRRETGQVPEPGGGGTNEWKGSALAAAIILIGFGLFTYFLPKIMLAAGAVSPYAAGAIVVFFIVGLFLILWLRGQVQRRRNR